jgi:HEAT repeat protein
VPVPYPVPMAPPPAPPGPVGYTAPPSVLSTVKVPSASGGEPVLIDVIRGDRGPSKQVPFTPPKTQPTTRKAEGEEIPAASLAAVEASPAKPALAAPQTKAGALPAFLVETLGDEDPQLQMQAVKALLWMGKEGRAHLAGAARSANPRVRAMALWSLGYEDATAEEIALIVQGMKDENPGVREQAVRAANGLGATAANSTREPLLAAMQDSEQEVREAASGAVVVLGPGIIPLLMESLAADKESVRDAAGKALIRFGAPAVPPLAKALSSEKPHVRFWAAYSLGELGDAAEEAVPALERMAQTDPDRNVRYYALAAVRKLSR